jgi:hypothetical protein
MQTLRPRLQNFIVPPVPLRELERRAREHQVERQACEREIERERERRERT